ncbi:MAG: hypothetical protein AAGJ40_09465 [Planctomycetota bacterium]
MRRLHEIVSDMDRTPREVTDVVRKSRVLSLLDGPKVDVDAMTCEVRVCTDIIDYQQEVILASGVKTENHRLNPQVWFEHGEDPLFTLTLALAEDAEKNYTVTMPDDFSMDAVSHFAIPASEWPIVYQLFGMIDKGALRATSIHVQPEPGGLSVYSERGGGSKYQVTEDSHLIEYSHCKVGVNPEALKKALRLDSKVDPLVPPELIRAVELQANQASALIRTGKVGNHALLPEIKKSLTAMTRTGNSMTLKTGDAGRSMAARKKSISAKDLVGMSVDEVKAIATDEAKLTQYDRPSQARVKSMFSKVMKDNEPGGEGEEEEHEEGDAKSVHHSEEQDGEGAETQAEDPTEEPVTEASDGGDDDDDDDEPEAEDGEEKAINDKPLGQTVMGEAYEALTFLLDKLESAMGPVEHPDVKGGMTEIMGQARGLTTAMDGLHEKAYGKPCRSDEADADDEKEKMMSEQLKSFLARRQNQTEHFQVIGQASQLRRLSKDKSIPSAARKSLRNLSQGLSAIEDAAREEMAEGVTKADFDRVIAERDAAIAGQKKAIGQRDQLMAKLSRDVLPAS